MKVGFIPKAVVLIGKSFRFFVCCGGQCCMGEDVQIPHLTKTEAKELGWFFTDDIKFCPPDESIAIICPDCRGYVLKEINK